MSNLETKTLVWHEPTDSHAVFDHPSQVHEFVNNLLGRPTDASVEVIPKEFHIFDVPYFGMVQP